MYDSPIQPMLVDFVASFDAAAKNICRVLLCLMGTSKTVQDERSVLRSADFHLSHFPS